MQTIIKTNNGDVHAELVEDKAYLQLNVFHTPKVAFGTPSITYKEVQHGI